MYRHSPQVLVHADQAVLQFPNAYLPTIPTESAREALNKYYLAAAQIKYLFYTKVKPIPIDKAPRLALVTYSVEDEKKALTEKDTDFSKSSFHEERVGSYEELYSTRTKTLITFQGLWPEQETQQSVCILGRAGIGKTTLCQYIASQWSQGRLWTYFDWIFWIPLRRIANDYYRNESRSITELLKRECFFKMNGILPEFQGKILYLLDGYDEIASQHQEGSNIGTLLDALLQEPHLITARPHALPPRMTDYRVIENVGFLNDDIRDYCDKFFTTIYSDKEKAKACSASLRQRMRQNPSIWGTAHIPITLELICSVWDGNQDKLESTLTMTTLYKQIMYKLLKRYLIQRTTNRLSVADVSILKEHEILKLCESVMEFLVELARSGLEDPKGNLIIPKKMIDKILENYTEITFKDILEAGFIKGTGSDPEPAEQDCYFIHLTFQEYMVAWNIYKKWQSKDIKISEQAIAYLKEHQFDPKYEIVWWFMSGLLAEDKPNRDAFLKSLQDPPHDLTRLYGQTQLMRCMEESEILSNSEDLSAIGLTTQVFRAWFQESLRYKPHYSDTCQNYHLLCPNLMQAIDVCGLLQGGLQDENLSVQRNAIRAVSQFIRTKPELLRIIEDYITPSRDNHIKCEFIEGMIHWFEIDPKRALQHLQRFLKEKDQMVLSKAEKFFEVIIEMQEHWQGASAEMKAIIAMIPNEVQFSNWRATVDKISKSLTSERDSTVQQALVNSFTDVQQTAAERISISPAPDQPAVIQQDLHDKDIHIRRTAIEQIRILPVSEQVAAILQALQDINLGIRHAAIEMIIVLPMIKQALIITQALKSKHADVRQAAIEKIVILPVSEQISIILNALKYAHADARLAALKKITLLPILKQAAVIQQALRDRDLGVRCAAIDLIASLPPLKQTYIIQQALESDYTDVRHAAIERITILPVLEQAAAIERALQDRELKVCQVAVEKITILPVSEQTSAIQQALKNKHEDVRRAAVEKITTLPPQNQILIINQALKSWHVDVYQAAVGKITILPASKRAAAIQQALLNMHLDIRRTAFEKIMILPKIEQTLIIQQALKSEYADVRQAAIERITILPVLEQAAAVRKALLDAEWKVCQVAVEKITILPVSEQTSTIQQALKNKHEDVRRAAVEKITILSVSEQMAAVQQALQDIELSIRCAAISIITSLPETEQALVVQQALKSKYADVQQAAIERITILSVQERTAAIRKALLNAKSNAYQAAVEKITTLPISEQTSIIQLALKNKNADVRRAGVEKIALLPASEQTAVIQQALDDTELIVWQAAFFKIIVLAESERLYFLTKALKNENLEFYQIIFNKLETFSESEKFLIAQSALQNKNQNIRILGLSYITSLIHKGKNIDEFHFDLGCQEIKKFLISNLHYYLKVPKNILLPLFDPRCMDLLNGLSNEDVQSMRELVKEYNVSDSILLLRMLCSPNTQLSHLAIKALSYHPCNLSNCRDRRWQSNLAVYELFDIYRATSITFIIKICSQDKQVDVRFIQMLSRRLLQERAIIIKLDENRLIVIHRNNREEINMTEERLSQLLKIFQEEIYLAKVLPHPSNITPILEADIAAPQLQRSSFFPAPVHPSPRFNSNQLWSDVKNDPNMAMILMQEDHNKRQSQNACLLPYVDDDELWENEDQPNEADDDLTSGESFSRTSSPQ